MTAFSGDFRLRDACAEPGCPICRCLESDGRRHLDAIIYEHVNDPDTRAALRASWGFCNWHTWMLRDLDGALTGGAILYEDLLGTVLRRVRTRAVETDSLARRLSGLFVDRRPVIATRYERRLACPICTRSLRSESRYVDALLRGIGHADFDEAYDASDGVCLPHLVRVLERGTRTRAAEKLLARTLVKWQALRHDLQRFVGKHDYRNREPFTPAEVAASTRAFEALAGRRALFGNDRQRQGRREIARARRRGA